jgi:hypothetical protein
VPFPNRIAIAPHIVWRDVEGELVLFDEDAQLYFALNEWASFLWRRIGRGMAVPAILNEVTQTYAEDAEQIAQDISAFLTSALAANLLVPRDEETE